MLYRTPDVLSDSELLSEVVRIARVVRTDTAELIEHLAELDRRKLYRSEGFSSLFVYCREVLRLSESETFNRTVAARVVRRYPVALELLRDGRVNLTTVRLLAPHLTHDNCASLFSEAVHKSKRQVQELVARHSPLPDVPALIRRVPRSRAATAPTVEIDGQLESEAATATEVGIIKAAVRPDPVGTMLPEVEAHLAPDQAAVARLADCRAEPSANATSSRALAPVASAPKVVVTPLAPDRYLVRFTASGKTCEKLGAAKDLLRHAVPTGDTAEIFDRALSALLESAARQKFAATERPRENSGAQPNSRHVPAAIRRKVWVRDVGRCAFVATNGRRCMATALLEFHHVRPYEVGGTATVENISLRCRSHNAHEADVYYAASRDIGRWRTSVASGKASQLAGARPGPACPPEECRP